MAAYMMRDRKIVAMSWYTSTGGHFTEDPWDLAIAQWKLEQKDNHNADEEPF